MLWNNQLAHITDSLEAAWKDPAAYADRPEKLLMRPSLANESEYRETPFQRKSEQQVHDLADIRLWH